MNMKALYIYILITIATMPSYGVDLEIYLNQSPNKSYRIHKWENGTVRQVPGISSKNFKTFKFVVPEQYVVSNNDGSPNIMQSLKKWRRKTISMKNNPKTKRGMGYYPFTDENGKQHYMAIENLGHHLKNHNNVNIDGSETKYIKPIGSTITRRSQLTGNQSPASKSKKESLTKKKEISDNDRTTKIKFRKEQRSLNKCATIKERVDSFRKKHAHLSNPAFKTTPKYHNCLKSIDSDISRALLAKDQVEFSRLVKARDERQIRERIEKDAEQNKKIQNAEKIKRDKENFTAKKKALERAKAIQLEKDQQEAGMQKAIQDKLAADKLAKLKDEKQAQLALAKEAKALKKCALIKKKVDSFRSNKKYPSNPASATTPKYHACLQAIETATSKKLYAEDKKKFDELIKEFARLKEEKKHLEELSKERLAKETIKNAEKKKAEQDKAKNIALAKQAALKQSEVLRKENADKLEAEKKRIAKAKAAAEKKALDQDQQEAGMQKAIQNKLSADKLAELKAEKQAQLALAKEAKSLKKCERLKIKLDKHRADPRFPLNPAHEATASYHKCLNEFDTDTRKSLLTTDKTKYDELIIAQATSKREQAEDGVLKKQTLETASDTKNDELPASENGSVIRTSSATTDIPCKEELKVVQGYRKKFKNLFNPAKKSTLLYHQCLQKKIKLGSTHAAILLKKDKKAFKTLIKKRTQLKKKKIARKPKSSDVRRALKKLRALKKGNIKFLNCQAASKSDPASCVLCNCYNESGGTRGASKDDDKGAYYTTRSLMARARRRSFPSKNLCQAAYKSARNTRGIRIFQFSWVPKPKSAKGAGLRRCLTQTIKALSTPPSANDPDHYHAHYVKPTWAKKRCMRKVTRSTGHAYYRTECRPGARKIKRKKSKSVNINR